MPSLFSSVNRIINKNPVEKTDHRFNNVKICVSLSFTIINRIQFKDIDEQSDSIKMQLFQLTKLFL